MGYKEAPIVSLSHDKLSVVYKVMCYLSHLAYGRSRRLTILVRLRGCADLDDSWRKFPEDLILLRQSATAAQCSIDRRQRSVQQAGRLPLFATGSPQLSLEDVGEIADKF